MGLFDPIDWNGNGKYDAGDSFIDYMIFNEVTKETESQMNGDSWDDDDSDSDSSKSGNPWD